MDKIEINVDFAQQILNILKCKEKQPVHNNEDNIHTVIENLQLLRNNGGPSNVQAEKSRKIPTSTELNKIDEYQCKQWDLPFTDLSELRDHFRTIHRRIVVTIDSKLLCHDCHDFYADGRCFNRHKCHPKSELTNPNDPIIVRTNSKKLTLSLRCEQELSLKIAQNVRSRQK